MLKNTNFLCEIGTEEIPAGYIPPAIEAMKKMFTQRLEEERIDFDELEVYATPRRFAFMVSSLAPAQREEDAELKGPAVRAAYDGQGNPTRALQGFMDGNGIRAEDVFTRDTGKGDYVFARKKLSAKKSEEILPAIVKSIIESIPFPKRMKWSDKNITFPRPIRYFLILHNDNLIPFAIEGIESSDKTRGHYIQHNTMADVKKIGLYTDILRKNGVIINHDERRELIRKGLDDAARKCGGRIVEDAGLLETVTFLVEQPYVTVCDFDESFLSVPDIALIAEMKEHQKYFPVVDAAGKLTNKFLVVCNNPETKNVIDGNRRVVTARFNDAMFFYKEDRKMKLEQRVDALKSVLFHKELGSIYDKIARMQKVASYIAGRLGLDRGQAGKVERAVLLCKADLETAMVYEFTSLQGHMGKIYALLDGEDREVADAIEDHYRPRFQGDEYPSSIVSVIVSMSEKIDNIFGSFSVGNIPKGSQDPYALRRQANAIVEMVIRNNMNISIRDLLDTISGNYKNGKELVDKILDFISARAKTIFSDRGFSHDEIDACLSAGSSDFFELHRRALSINEFRKKENFSQMLLSLKRMNNIVSAFRREYKDYVLHFNEKLLTDDAEKNLHDFFSKREGLIEQYIRESRYIDLFEVLIEGKSIIDAFFDHVLVMDPNTMIRDNRLHVLEKILGNFKELLDFSKISDK